MDESSLYRLVDLNLWRNVEYYWISDIMKEEYLNKVWSKQPFSDELEMTGLISTLNISN